MEKLDLKNEILELIERHAEGEYWDFKQQWHSNNADLLHDIICMANSPANRDCYIIIGVEDKTYNVLGVNDENRKNQQNVIDLLRQKPSWAGGYIPEVYVKTISIDDKKIDVVVVKQSDNTPFYLLEDYKKEGQLIYKGAIYTRKGDTNIPKTKTANIHETELLWKRRFGLLYNPSQRAKSYLKDLDNWQLVESENIKSNGEYTLFYYKLDPDYTIYLVYEDINITEDIIVKNINDLCENNRGVLFFYIFAFCNISYHIDFFDHEKIVLYYKEIPLFSSNVECIDEGRTVMIPPEYWSDAYFIKDDFRYLMLEFSFYHLCTIYSSEAKEMFLRVIPVYDNEDEYNEFNVFVKRNGFSRERLFESKIGGNALERLKNTIIYDYKFYGDPSMIEKVSYYLLNNKKVVINFCNPQNKEYDEITRYLQTGKMLVDWRIFRNDN